MNFLGDGFGGYLTIVLAGILATEVWRWLGLAVGSRLDVAGAPFQWMRAVATALVSGLVARMHGGELPRTRTQTDVMPVTSND